VARLQIIITSASTLAGRGGVLKSCLPPICGAAAGGVRCSGRPRSGGVAGETPGGTAGARLKRGDLEVGREASLRPLGCGVGSPAGPGDLGAPSSPWTGAGPAGAGALS
jgi:hypothetical protein